MRAVLDAAIDIDHTIAYSVSPGKRKFTELARKQGVKAALAWREAR